MVAAPVVAPHDPRACRARPTASRARGARWHPRTGEYDVRRIVPFNEHPSSADSTRPAASRAAAAVLVALVAAVVLAVAGTTVGYAALSNSVTLSVDGQEPARSARWAAPSATSSTPRASRSASTTSSRPALDEQVDGRQPDHVRFGRPLELERRRRDADPLGHLHRRRLRARRDRQPLLRRRPVHQPRRRHRPRRHGARGRDPQDAQGHARRQEAGQAQLTALTAEEALEGDGVKVEQATTSSSPAAKTELEDGDQIVFTDIRVVTKRVKREAVDFGTVEREDSSMFEGETEIVRSGSDGAARRDLPAHLPQRRARQHARC